MESKELFIGEGEVSHNALIRVRCPGCNKLFAVEAAEIHESQPKFQCSQCSKKFWIPFPECLMSPEIIGFPEEWLARGREGLTGTDFIEKEVLPAAPQTQETSKVQAAPTKPCPRCEAPYRMGDTECPKCGVVFAKLTEKDEASTVPSSPHLRRLWFQVVDDYDSIEAHRRFVKACGDADNLPYASQQYRRVLTAHSGDETALQMQREIAALAEVKTGLLPKRTFQVSIKVPKATTWFMLLGGAMIGVGLSSELARNLVGLGVAVVFFSGALRWYLQGE